MSSSAYDPRKFEFVARMGRIAESEDYKKTKEEKIPVMFRIPDPPEQEIVTVPLGRSMRAVPLGENKPINFDDYILDLPSEDNNTVNVTNSELLQNMMESRKKVQQEREMRQHAQYLINEALLQNELKDMKEKEELLKKIYERKDSISKNGDIDKANIFREPLENEELKNIIREELKRLVPIIPDQRSS